MVKLLYRINFAKSTKKQRPVTQGISIYLKINQMSYDSLIIVIEQYKIGGAESAINYIHSGRRILETKRIHG
ncbi:MAG: hypothetical protein MAG458_01746 [Nitrosopumilus sp.]|nr:hypothetical protein [Nitrosopumilus sp.]